MVEKEEQAKDGELDIKTATLALSSTKISLQKSNIFAKNRCSWKRFFRKILLYTLTFSIACFAV